MTDKPIPFSAPMVRALLEGRKTMTRRVLKPQPNMLNGGLPMNDGRGSYSVEGGWRKYPYAVGDRLWVREAWRTVIGVDDLPPRDLVPGLLPFSYEADYTSEPNDGCRGRYRHARFMPRWASRITLEVTGVRVERLQDISEEDAKAEGVERRAWEAMPLSGLPDGYRCGFAQLWTSLHGPGAWEANPWVAVIEFKRMAG